VGDRFVGVVVDESLKVKLETYSGVEHDNSLSSISEHDECLESILVSSKD
jgi:hypothetical protein